MSKKFKLIFSICLFVIAGLAVNFAFAQNFGVNEVNKVIGLSQVDPRIIIGRVIQIALSFLGIIALLLTVYAGFIWMTSNGEEEKVGQAKKIIKNALIGLVIILSAWGITTFILNKLRGATGFGNENNIANINQNIADTGLGSVGACTVESFYPDQGQKDIARNTSIMVTFKQKLDPASICANKQGDSCACDSNSCSQINPKTFRLYKSDLGDACTDTKCPSISTNITTVKASLSNDQKTIILTPENILGTAANDTWYTMKINSGLKSADGISVFKMCSSGNLEWKFEVTTRLDLTPPEVALAKVFPSPDNQRDVKGEVNPAKKANALITVHSCPQTYLPAKLLNISPPGPNMFLDYHGTINNFKISIPAGQTNKAQLFNGNDDTLIGIADFNKKDIAVFSGYFSFQASNRQAGNLWKIKIQPERLADTLTVGSMLYTFADSAKDNNILVKANCSNSQQALAIQAKLSGNPEIDVSRINNKVTLLAKVAGKSGNEVTLQTTNIKALTLVPFSGGIDQKVVNKVEDKLDSPMNSIIQINFNEAINPVTVAGTAAEVSNYIRVVNAKATSTSAGTACSVNADCRSYSCQNKSCQGDYLAGRFLLSNAYKTVEFISDNQCGVNACGEKIYCLPADSNLEVDLIAANLHRCQTDNDCAAFTPFNTCANSSLDYKTCQNKDGNNYPLAKTTKLDGIVDAAFNSLDGNRDTFAVGPINFFNENKKINTNQGDNYKFSFYITNQISLNPPKITLITPSQGQNKIGLAKPVKINFNSLMMNSSLKTGSITTSNGTSITSHKLLNLWSSSSKPLGYWITSENNDVYPLDGIPDLTSAYIEHTSLAQSASYKVQVGSGVKDIYQNCFKPSIGPDCSATPTDPSCCFGKATNKLGPDGNCQ